MPSRLIDSFATTRALADVFSDASVLDAMLQFETALARSQAALGIIPPHAADAIAQVDRIEPACFSEAARECASLAIPFVKTLTDRVREIDPEAADFVHLGATSQDMLDSALVLLLGRARRVLEPDHARLEDTLRALSDQHARTVMLARTLLQPALPTTFGYKVADGTARCIAVGPDWRKPSMRLFSFSLVAQSEPWPLTTRVDRTWPRRSRRNWV